MKENRLGKFGHVTRREGTNASSGYKNERRRENRKRKTERDGWIRLRI